MLTKKEEIFGMKLFLGSLPYGITESDLSELCSQFGTVLSAKLIIDHYSGHSKGFAFVEMSNRSEGHKVMEGLNGTEYKYKKLVCKEAIPQKKKSYRRG